MKEIYARTQACLPGLLIRSWLWRRRQQLIKGFFQGQRSLQAIQMALVSRIRAKVISENAKTWALRYVARELQFSTTRTARISS